MRQPRSSIAPPPSLPPPEVMMRDESRRPAFCTNPLDRTSAEKDPPALERALRSSETLHVVLRGEEPVLLREGGRQSALAPLGSTPALIAADQALLQAFL